jgi:D-alanyl-D-alanine carboxypeptidase
MKQTTFRNASGLPDSRQLTTARDMAILARALMLRFPDEYAFFSTQSFRYEGRTYQTHNRVLKNYPGADGLKTGYTRASGYNLATTAQRNGHRLIGVVLGGRSTRTRDAQMMAMLDKGFVLADSGAMSVATSLPSAQNPAKAVAKATTTNEVPFAMAMIPPTKPVVTIEDPEAPSLDSLVAQVLPTAEAEGDGGITAEPLLPPAAVTQVASVTTVAIPAASTPANAAAPKLGSPDDGKIMWGIQVGAFTGPDAAKKAATAATEKAPALLKGTQVAVDLITGEDGGKLYRARLVGLGEKDARKACTELQNQSMPCMAFKANVTLAFNQPQ